MTPNQPELVQAPPKPALPPAAPNTPKYEFSVGENAVIGILGSRMSFVGLFMLGIGLFFFGSGILRWRQIGFLEPGLLFLALLFIVVGIWTHRAGRGFKKVVSTTGNDITHLMLALENLFKMYTLLYLLFLVALVFAIIQLAAHSLYGT